MNSVNTWGLDVFSAATLIKVHFSNSQCGNDLFCLVVFLISIVINNIYIKLI